MRNGNGTMKMRNAIDAQLLCRLDHPPKSRLTPASETRSETDSNQEMNEERQRAAGCSGGEEGQSKTTCRHKAGPLRTPRREQVTRKNGHEEAVRIVRIVCPSRHHFAQGRPVRPEQDRAGNGRQEASATMQSQPGGGVRLASGRTCPCPVTCRGARADR